MADGCICGHIHSGRSETELKVTGEVCSALKVLDALQFMNIEDEDYPVNNKDWSYYQLQDRIYILKMLIDLYQTKRSLLKQELRDLQIMSTDGRLEALRDKLTSQ